MGPRKSFKFQTLGHPVRICCPCVWMKSPEWLLLCGSEKSCYFQGKYFATSWPSTKETRLVETVVTTKTNTKQTMATTATAPVKSVKGAARVTLNSEYWPNSLSELILCLVDCVRRKRQWMTVSLTPNEW